MFREDRNRKQLNAKERAAIVALTVASKSIREISGMLGVGKATVSLWQKRHEETGDVEKKVGSGSKRKTTPAEDRRLVVAVQAHPITTAQEIAGNILFLCITLLLRRCN